MLEEILKETRLRMENQLNRFSEEIKTLRVGKGESSLLSEISVSFYGTRLSLKEMASISTPVPNLIIIKPWDKNALGDIELAIRNSGLSLNPINDGNVIRISLPPLSQERREELVKILKRKGEERRVALRMIRREARDKLIEGEREKRFSENERDKGLEELDKMIADFNKKIEEALSSKEEEIMRL